VLFCRRRIDHTALITIPLEELREGVYIHVLRGVDVSYDTSSQTGTRGALKNGHSTHSKVGRGF